MVIVDFESMFRQLEEQSRQINDLLDRVNQILARYNSGSRYGDECTRKKEKALRRELLLNKANQLFQLIRLIIKHNQILKKNRLFNILAVFNFYRKHEQHLIEDLLLVTDEKLIVNSNDKERGGLQWQQVFA
ncbi:hypothetical protein LFR94_002346 [Vibrio vulnificus]|uniref:hypothetical protein n=1 Tax=Vibrio vulnificus TaxID=672 RepID=UPI001A1B4988|nr:hypothetical protein [Vibrio vulnificus]EGQ7985340.1 hypothetical protein [Vibrio vulnificus]EGQ9237263.1 hypothetical protein [Vibrio vulnificus]EGR7960313.1 hypothetical protein [Vibrio vulnificus]EGR7983263.1 hypothetical protein [Vibrio vulnificus]